MAKDDDSRQLSVEEKPTERAEALKAELFGSDLTVAEVAHILDVDRTTVLRYLRDNVIFGYQLGREWRIPEGELRDYRRNLMEQRRKEVRHTTTEAEIDKKLRLLTGNAAEDEDPPWRKLWCHNCAGPVLGEFRFDPDEGNTWYDGHCDYCNSRVAESVRPRPWSPKTTVTVLPSQPAIDTAFGDDEGDIPF